MARTNNISGLPSNYFLSVDVGDSSDAIFNAAMVNGLDVIQVTGVLTRNTLFTFPATIGNNLHFQNLTTGAFTLTLTSGGETVAVPQGELVQLGSDLSNNWYFAGQEGLFSAAVTVADITPTAQQAENNVYNMTGLLTGNRKLILPLTAGARVTVLNSTTGAFTLTLIGATGTGVAIPQGGALLCYCDGTNWYNAAPEAVQSAVGAGTAYTLTGALAPVIFGTTQVQLVLAPGTYEIIGMLDFVGGTAADDLQGEIYNTTAAATIDAPSHLPAIASGAGFTMQMIAEVTLTVVSTITMWAGDLTGVRGTINAAGSSIQSKRLA